MEPSAIASSPNKLSTDVTSKLAGDDWGGGWASWKVSQRAPTELIKLLTLTIGLKEVAEKVKATLKKQQLNNLIIY